MANCLDLWILKVITQPNQLWKRKSYRFGKYGT